MVSNKKDWNWTERVTYHSRNKAAKCITHSCSCRKPALHIASSILISAKVLEHLPDLEAIDKSLSGQLTMQLGKLAMHALDSLKGPVRVLAHKCLAVLVKLLFAADAAHGVTAGSDESAAASARLAISAPHDLIF
jgi:hypothetical protein